MFSFFESVSFVFSGDYFHAVSFETIIFLGQYNLPNFARYTGMTGGTFHKFKTQFVDPDWHGTMPDVK